MKEKPSFDLIFMNLATDLASRSHCVKAQVGAVLTKDTRIISVIMALLQVPIIVMRSGLIPAVPVTLRIVALLHYMLKKMLFCTQ
jgi:hypothetical protein